MSVDAGSSGSWPRRAVRSATGTCRGRGRWRTTRRCSPASRAARRCPRRPGRSRTSLVTRLVTDGVLFAPLVLHTGVSSPEAGEPPQAERFRVPPTTAALVSWVRSRGGRVIAVGTTAARAVESSLPGGVAEGWTDLVLGPDRPARVLDGIVTGLHAPEASHLLLAGGGGRPGAGPARLRRGGGAPVPLARVRRRVPAATPMTSSPHPRSGVRPRRTPRRRQRRAGSSRRRARSSPARDTTAIPSPTPVTIEATRLASPVCQAERPAQVDRDAHRHRQPVPQRETRGRTPPTAPASPPPR